MFITQLGRQPELSFAELAAVFGAAHVTQVAAEFATVDTKDFDLDQLGGTIKYGEIITTLPAAKNDAAALAAASKFITATYRKQWQSTSGKLTLGLSAHNLHVSPRAVQKIGLILKATLKPHGVNLRLIPNAEPALSTATSHNNRLGTSERKIELLIIRTNKGLVIAESRGVQNIATYTHRDRHRPRRDAFVGMLPPKLAQIMLNLAVGAINPPAALPTVSSESNVTDYVGNRVIDSSERLASGSPVVILDPFCGTGTVLQEALLRGFSVVGSDLSEKMVAYTRENLGWLQEAFHTTGTILNINPADATSYTWNIAHAIDAVVCETYLGQPFSAPPSPAKLKEVVRNCNHIISTFLRNIHPQLQPGTPLCIAVPAWQSTDGRFTHLPLIKQLRDLGFERTITAPLLYHRPGQVVARELLVIKTTNAPKTA
jgi:tRNA G10  N-methylase Trm11